MINFIKSIFTQNYFDFIIILLLFLFIFFLTIFIPNKIKILNHKKFIKNLKIGDDVLTVGGIIGKIYKFINNDCLLLIINNNQKILLNKNYIKSILLKKNKNN